MSWLFMIGAIFFEVVGTVSLKLSEGFTQYLYVGITIAGYVTSFALLGMALKGLPVSMVYAIWSGAGTALVAVIGIVILGEEANLLKVASIGLVIIGVIGISLADKTS